MHRSQSGKGRKLFPRLRNPHVSRARTMKEHRTLERKATVAAIRELGEEVRPARAGPHRHVKKAWCQSRSSDLN